jgi:hypothetical protein
LDLSPKSIAFFSSQTKTNMAGDGAIGRLLLLLCSVALPMVVVVVVVEVRFSVVAGYWTLV